MEAALNSSATQPRLSADDLASVFADALTPEPLWRVGTEAEKFGVLTESGRPIAYDVDYVYKGTKFRSRLPEDPGKRLRIRFSVVPYPPQQDLPVQ